MRRGNFIVFEGGEGTGKSTQIHSLQKFLTEKKFEVVLSWEPGGTPIGSAIREILLSTKSTGMSARCEALLYSAARAEHVEKLIKPALERGAIVLCDRYWDASRAYQGFGRGLGTMAIDSINLWATEGLFPDRVYLFDLDPEKGLGRVKQRGDGSLDRLESESIDFHKKIRQAYLHLANSDRSRYLTIDASRELTEISKDIEADFTTHFLKETP